MCSPSRARWGRQGAVWAIEPHPVSFAILCRFCELNRLANVTALNYACLDQPGELQIETLPVWESNYVRAGEPSPSSHPVKGVRFDDWRRSTESSASIS